jgi:hypothetical protein
MGERRRLVRVVNDAIFPGPSRRELALRCECGRFGCNRLVVLTGDEYEAVRRSASWFVVVPSHELGAFGSTVEWHERYVVFEARDSVAGHVAGGSAEC